MPLTVQSAKKCRQNATRIIAPKFFFALFAQLLRPLRLKAVALFVITTFVGYSLDIQMPESFALAGGF
jgi:hypothetical protein